jgi:hypothetical protein
MFVCSDTDYCETAPPRRAGGERRMTALALTPEPEDKPLIEVEG